MINRRNFLGIAWGTSLLGLFGQAGVALLNFIKPKIEAGAFGGKIVAGNVDEFPNDSVSHVQQGQFYLVRLEDGGMLALWHRCTHLGCTIPWEEGEGVFQCPCHSSVFTPTGEIVSGPAPRPMDIFPITIENDEIIVDTGKPIERTGFDPSQATHT